MSRSAITVTGIDGVARNNSRTNGSTAVNDVTTAGREYLGCRSDTIAHLATGTYLTNGLGIKAAYSPRHCDAEP